MNTNQSGRMPGNDDLTELLQSFRPARANIDPAALFYQAGFKAGQTERTSEPIPHWRALAAGFIAAVLAAPAGYVAGQASLRTPQVAAEPQRSEQLHAAAIPPPQPNLAPAVETSREPFDAVVSHEPSFFATYAPILISLWGQPSAEASGSTAEQPTASLAAFHSFVSSSSGNGKRWPEYFVQCDALLHSDPSITTVSSDALSSSTMAVGDAQQMATMMEAIR